MITPLNILSVKESWITRRSSSIPSFGGQSKLYISIRGESILEHLMNRKYRPYTLYKKEIIPKVFEQLGIDPEKVKPRWRQKCGCTCPCSPGFVLEGHYGKEISVVIGEEENV